MLWLYLSLALVGAVLPYAQFLPWLAEHGLNLGLLMTELFSTRIGGFFGLDVLVSAVALIAFIRSEGARRKMNAVAADRRYLPGWCELRIAAFLVSARAPAGA
jgi:hypothetical protein